MPRQQLLHSSTLPAQSSHLTKFTICMCVAHTHLQDGLLPAAFMVGLLLSSPIFAEASKYHNAFRLIGVGLAVWTAAAAGCGLAPGFTSLLLCRMAVGVGEASFVALAAPFIGELA